MNEHELSKLLHEAAGEAGVSSTATRRVLRRARLRMATTGVLALSIVALLAGGAFAVVTRTSETGPETLESARSPVVVAPDAPESDVVLSEDDGILLAEVQESDDRTWTFSGKARGSELCFTSTAHRGTSASGVGDCGQLGVPGNRHLGFFMWDSEESERLEVLGAVSPEVVRLELQGSNASDDVIPIIQAPDELGDDRNFFYLWLPMHEVGTLAAYDEAGDILLEEPLCLKAYEPQGSACTVGDRSSSSGSARAELPPDTSPMACNEISRGKVGRLSAESTPEQTMQRWIDDLELDLTSDDFEIERAGSDTAVMNLRTPGGDSSVSATLRKKGDHLWSIVELYYCGGILDPITDPPRIPKKLLEPPPPPPSPPPTPSP